MINEKDIIFIDSSTTTLQMAEFIDVKRMVTVVTNGITLATLLAKKGIKTYCTGGEIFENSLANFGSFAEEFIKKFNFDKMFFSCYGVNDKGMLTDPSLPETQIRKIATEQSKKTIFLCDESKFSLSAPYNLMAIEKLDFIITNTNYVYEYFEEKDYNKIIIA
jgi:DeoR/GlpR family transcriptional regulator of sugar metabolism